MSAQRQSSETSTDLNARPKGTAEDHCSSPVERFAQLRRHGVAEAGYPFTVGEPQAFTPVGRKALKDGNLVFGEAPKSMAADVKKMGLLRIFPPVLPYCCRGRVGRLGPVLGVKRYGRTPMASGKLVARARRV